MESRKKTNKIEQSLCEISKGPSEQRYGNNTNEIQFLVRNRTTTEKNIERAINHQARERETRSQRDLTARGRLKCGRY